MTCSVCGAATADAFLCLGCTRRFVRACREAEEFARELVVTTSRQARVISSEAGRATRASEPPLPFAVAASEASDLLGATLAAWTALCGPVPPRGASVALLARLLASRASVARRRPDAAALLEEVEHAVAQAVAAVDHPPARWFAGRCSCGAELHPVHGERVIVCQACGARLDAGDRRTELLARAHDRNLTARDLYRALGAMGLALTPAALRGHERRGNLASVGTDAQGRKLFRLGDVLPLVPRSSE